MLRLKLPEFLLTNQSNLKLREKSLGNSMRFELGSQVKWKDASQIRLGYTPRDVGKVVGVHEYVARDFEIDVEFSDGDVLRGATGDWFEPVEAPASPN